MGKQELKCDILFVKDLIDRQLLDLLILDQTLFVMYEDEVLALSPDDRQRLRKVFTLLGEHRQHVDPVGSAFFEGSDDVSEEVIGELRKLFDRDSQVLHHLAHRTSLDVMVSNEVNAVKVFDLAKGFRESDIVRITLTVYSKQDSLRDMTLETSVRGAKKLIDHLQDALSQLEE